MTVRKELILLSAVILLLTACGQSAGSSSGSTEIAQTAETAASETVSVSEASVEVSSNTYPTISIIGDSWSAYAGMIPTGYISSYKPVMDSGTDFSWMQMWWAQVCNQKGWLLNTLNACGGSGITDSDGMGTQANSVRASQCGTDPSRIIVFLGINDAINGVSMGTLSEQYPEMLRKIQGSYPDALIECCTYPHVPCADDKLIDDLDSVITSSCGDCGCVLIDCAGTDLGKDDFFDDGLHPNVQGQAKLAEVITSYIQ